jgi:hypothetical protein
MEDVGAGWPNSVRQDAQLHEPVPIETRWTGPAHSVELHESALLVPRALARGWKCRWMKVMELRTKPRRARSRGAVVLAVALAWIVVMLALAEVLASASSQAHARRDVAQKLAARTQAGAEFSSLYVTDILARERKQAGSWLTGRRPTRLSLARSSQALGFSAALLVDRGGRVLQTAPAQPDVMGVTITGLDPYLAPALAGRATVSNVVQSATGLPVVATAVRLRPPRGDARSAARLTCPRARWVAT